MMKVAAPLEMMRTWSVCESATSIEKEQPWGILPDWTCHWKRPRFAWSMRPGKSCKEARAASEPEALDAFFERRHEYGAFWPGGLLVDGVAAWR